MNNFATVLDDESEFSDLDFEILLLYLSRDCGAIAYDGKVRDHHKLRATSTH
jgi:charged multivesicular body protein 7